MSFRSLKADTWTVKGLIEPVAASRDKQRTMSPSDMTEAESEILDLDLRYNISQAQVSIEGAVSRLHRLGMTIRQSSTSSLASRVRAFSAKNYSSSLEEITSVIIANLYPNAPESLQRLLARSILERYLRLKYIEQHRDHLSMPRPTHSRSIDADDLVAIEQAESEGEPETIQEERPRVARDEVNEGFISHEDHNREGRQYVRKTERSSKPSTLPLNDMRNISEQRVPAAAASVASSVPLADTRYPRPPKPDGVSTVATCKWCFETYEVREFKKEYWWREVPIGLGLGCVLTS